MIGDSLSDIEFGQNLGMTTVFIEGDTKAREYRKPGAQRVAALLARSPYPVCAGVPTSPTAQS